jgi:carbonic anhydrase
VRGHEQSRESYERSLVNLAERWKARA